MQFNYSTVWTFVHFFFAHCGFAWPVSVGTIATAHQCRSNDDCGQNLGQSCYWLYDGCHVGQCMCDPRRHRQEPSGRCTLLKYGNEPCSGITDVCQEGMSCIDGYCQCTAGTMTGDGQYCLRPGQRLLGQKCWSSSSGSSSCLHKSSTGYTRYDVRCSAKGECECSEGYKADGITCRRWNMKEFGCTSTFHCQGGAICSEGQCICPRGYAAVAGNSKCAKRGAITELPSGAICDEINEQRYCGRSLVCHKCPEEEVIDTFSRRDLIFHYQGNISALPSVSKRTRDGRGQQTELTCWTSRSMYCWTVTVKRRVAQSGPRVLADSHSRNEAKSALES